MQTITHLKVSCLVFEKGELYPAGELATKANRQTKPRGESHVHIYLPAERCCAQQLRGPREVYAKRVVCSAPDTVYYFRITIAFEDCVYDLLKTCRDEEPDVFERFF